MEDRAGEGATAKGAKWLGWSPRSCTVSASSCRPNSSFVHIRFDYII